MAKEMRVELGSVSRRTGAKFVLVDGKEPPSKTKTKKTALNRVASSCVTCPRLSVHCPPPAVKCTLYLVPSRNQLLSEKVTQKQTVTTRLTELILASEKQRDAKLNEIMKKMSAEQKTGGASYPG